MLTSYDGILKIGFGFHLSPPYKDGESQSQISSELFLWLS